MGVIFDYFVAASDDDAARTIDWPGGPSDGPPRRRLFGKRSEGYACLGDSGIEPNVALGMFEELLTGRRFDDQLADPDVRPIVAERDNGERLVQRIGTQLVHALAASDDARIRSLALRWSQIEEFHGQFTPEELAEFAQRLRDLARQSTQTGAGVYCWTCV